MKKLLILVALLVVASMLFTACGAPAETGTTEPTTEPSADAKTIVYWSMWDSTEPQAIAIQKAVDAYMADTGNIVDVQFKGRTGQREGLEPALDAGTVIDLFDEDIDRVNGTWGDYLLDLEQFAADSDYEATANAALMAAVRDVSPDGLLRSIPYQPSVFAFFYNQAIFAEAGVEGVPTTWDEFLDACEKIKTAGYIPLTSDDAYMTTLPGFYLARMLGDDGVGDLVNNGEWAENPAALQMAEAYADLAAKGYFSPNIASNVWPAGQNGEFALGEVAMYLNGSWLPNEVRNITGDEFEWGCFSYPAVDGGANGPEASNFGGQAFGINKDSQVAAEAFELIEYITKGEYDLMLSQESLGIPADTTNTEWPVQLAEVQPVMDSLETRFVWAGNMEINADMTPVIKENFTKLVGGTMSAQEFIDAMEAASN